MKLSINKIIYLLSNEVIPQKQLYDQTLWCNYFLFIYVCEMKFLFV